MFKMVLTASFFGTGTSTGGLPHAGVGIGGIFVTAAVSYLLAYLIVIKTTEGSSARLEILLTATAIPLGITFAGIVLYQSLQVLEFL